MALDDVPRQPDLSQRAAMHYSLETRAPFLDHELVEFAWRIPTSVHFKDGKGKWLPRQALARFLPPELIDRPKMGFAIPLGEWLRDSLRDWAEDLLDAGRIRSEGWIDALALWGVLMFQAWLRAEAAIPAGQAA